jgi:hypothetical protein
MDRATASKQLSRYYRDDLRAFYKFNITENSKILEIGYSPVFTKKSVNPSDLDKISINGKLDFILISDTLGNIYDVQNLFNKLKRFASDETRIMFNYHSYFWQPLLELAEFTGLKAKTQRANWLNEEDIWNLMELEDMDIVKKEKRYLFPVKIARLTEFINKYIARLPVFNSLCLTNFVVTRTKPVTNQKPISISIVIPARNERGNIEKAVRELKPYLLKDDELIFVEGHSTDETWEEILRVKKKYSKLNIEVFKQKGKGKADAVRLGFAKAKGDWLLIWDADLTVPPEDYPKFAAAARCGKGEYINGSRLVYPMEKQAMQFLNVIGNRFFSIAFSWMLGQQIKDTLCGSKAISRQNYVRLAKNRKYFGDFDPFGDFDLIFGAAKMNLKFIEIPIRYRARTYGKTNISRFTHGWLLLKMLYFALGKMKFV